MSQTLDELFIKPNRGSFKTKCEHFGEYCTKRGHEKSPVVLKYKKCRSMYLVLVTLCVALIFDGSTVNKKNAARPIFYVPDLLTPH